MAEDILLTHGISIPLYPGELTALTQTTVTPTDALVAVRKELTASKASQATEEAQSVQRALRNRESSKSDFRFQLA